MEHYLDSSNNISVELSLPGISTDWVDFLLGPLKIITLIMLVVSKKIFTDPLVMRYGPLGAS